VKKWGPSSAFSGVSHSGGDQKFFDRPIFDRSTAGASGGPVLPSKNASWKLFSSQYARNAFDLFN